MTLGKWQQLIHFDCIDMRLLHHHPQQQPILQNPAAALLANRGPRRRGKDGRTGSPIPLIRLPLLPLLPD